MVQTGAFLADMPIEPSIAVGSLSGMITSFIIHYLNWQECKRFGVICPNWRLITQVDCLNGMRTVAFLDASAFELSRWRGGRYRVHSLKRRWSLEELTAERYDDVDMSGDTSSTSMNINNYLIAQLLFLQ